MLAVEEQTAPEDAVDPEITAMFKAGVHFGYRKTKRHPGMQTYLFGTKNNVEVFDLVKVQTKMREALLYIKKLGEEKKVLLLVGTKACAKEEIEKTAHHLSLPYVARRWLGGTLTNFKVISDRIAYWQNLEEQKASGELKKYTKQEQLKISEKIEQLQEMFGGLEHMKALPDAVFIIDMGEESTAVREAKRKHIPVIALSNCDTNPALADYIVPANDNARSSIAYILDKVVAAYTNG